MDILNTTGFPVGNGSFSDQIMKTPWNPRSKDECIQSLGKSAFLGGTDGIYCNATWDTILCWPPTAVGVIAKLHCPPLPGLDTTKYGYRTCGSEGRWEGRYPGDYSMPRGYTNYTECYTPETFDIYRKFFLDKTEEEQLLMLDTIQGTRTMQLVGLWLSLVSSIVSLVIFSYFRSLRCHRTRIHRNLFVSIIVQVVIRLTIYVDQFVSRMKRGDSGGTSAMGGAMYNMPVLCEIMITLLEYTKTVVFMWMLIEGLYLHNMIAVSVFSKKPNYVIFYAIGWGGPIPVTLAWSTTMAFVYKRKCWFPYHTLDYIWIIEVPRIAVILINLVFLLNIIRVLVLKLRDSHSNEPQVVKVRKTIKATLFLLPLLGITNVLVMLDEPSDPKEFAAWSYSSHFLSSFQGFIISLLYCFLNAEVQETIRRHLCSSSPVYSEHSRTSIRVYPPPNIDKLLTQVQLAFKKRWARFRQSRLVHNSSFRRLSRSFSVFTSLSEVPQNQTRLQAANGQIGAGPSKAPTTHVIPLLRDVIARQESGL